MKRRLGSFKNIVSFLLIFNLFFSSLALASEIEDANSHKWENLKKGETIEIDYSGDANWKEHGLEILENKDGKATLKVTENLSNLNISLKDGSLEFKEDLAQGEAVQNGSPSERDGNERECRMDDIELGLQQWDNESALRISSSEMEGYKKIKAVIDLKESTTSAESIQVNRLEDNGEGILTTRLSQEHIEIVVDDSNLIVTLVNPNKDGIIDIVYGTSGNTSDSMSFKVWGMDADSNEIDIISEFGNGEASGERQISDDLRTDSKETKDGLGEDGLEDELNNNEGVEDKGTDCNYEDSLAIDGNSEKIKESDDITGDQISKYNEKPAPIDGDFEEGQDINNSENQVREVEDESNSAGIPTEDQALKYTSKNENNYHKESTAEIEFKDFVSENLGAWDLRDSINIKGVDNNIDTLDEVYSSDYCELEIQEDDDNEVILGDSHSVSDSSQSIDTYEIVDEEIDEEIDKEIDKEIDEEIDEEIDKEDNYLDREEVAVLPKTGSRSFYFYLGLFFITIGIVVKCGYKSQP